MGHQILIVDDSPMLRAILAEMLVIGGHEIAGEAESGQEALRICRESKPDLVTLDISLPDTDGLELIDKFRKIHPGVRILLVTANIQKAVALKAQKSSVAVLNKPFTPQELLSAVAKALEGVG